MSDTESASYLETASLHSDSTIETLAFSQVLSLLQDAANDAKKLNDFLSYSTVLDIHLSSPDRYSSLEREELLEQLLQTLSKDPVLVQEVGWDIPALLMPFIDNETKYQNGIKNAPSFYRVMKIFEVLATNGNAKELFLKSCELLSSLQAGNEDDGTQFRFEIKLYCVFELITSCIRRIHTLYPSRFLSMAVSSYINCMHQNPSKTIERAVFFMRRVFSFARNYTAPPRPTQTDLDPKELAKIVEDENYLQRCLLTAFLTGASNMALRAQMLGLANSYFRRIPKPEQKAPAEVPPYENPVMARICELALSFDLTPTKSFQTFVESTENLFDLNKARTAKSEAFLGDLFETLVVNFQENFSNSIVDPKTKKVADSLGGLLGMYSYDVCALNEVKVIDVSITQAILITLRMVVPGLVHPSLVHRGFQDLAVFWCWRASQGVTPSSLELELSSIPEVVIMTFLQALLFVMVSAVDNGDHRYTVLTFLTKILSSIPEDLAFTFLLSSLRECPYENVKTALVGVLRVLLIRDKEVDQLTESMRTLGMATPNEEKKNPPPLPQRDSPVSRKYITLTNEREEEIVALIHTSIEKNFASPESPSGMNLSLLATLLAFLNLLIPLKRNSLMSDKRIEEICIAISKSIEETEHRSAEDKGDVNTLNAVSVLSIAINRLRE